MFSCEFCKIFKNSFLLDKYHLSLGERKKSNSKDTWESCNVKLLSYSRKWIEISQTCLKHCLKAHRKSAFKDVKIFSLLSKKYIETFAESYLTYYLLGVIHLVRTQNFPKNKYFLPSDTHTYVGVSAGKKWKFFGKFCARTKWIIPLVWILYFFYLRFTPCKADQPLRGMELQEKEV